jgi:hypothetical protein
MSNSASALNGLKGGRPRKYNRDHIISLYQSGMSKDQIASQLTCSWRTVHRVLINCKQIPNPIDKT